MSSSSCGRRIKKFTGKPAGIESLDNQLKQLRVRDEQFEKQTAQTVSFHESKELVQSRVGIGSFRQPIQQNRAQLLEYLASSRGDVKTRRASFKISQRFLRSLWIIENFQTDFGGLRRRFRDDPLKNGTDRSHPVLQRRCEIAGGRKAKAACETEQRFGLVWNSVGLLFRLDLHDDVRRGGEIDTHCPAPKLPREGANPVLAARGAPSACSVPAETDDALRG